VLTPAELLVRIRDAGNELRIPNLPPAERAEYRKVIWRLLNDDDLLPAGMRLRHTGRDHGDLVLRLVPDTEEHRPRPLEPAVVPVPEQLRRPHPLLTATKTAAKPREGGSTPDAWLVCCT